MIVDRLAKEFNRPRAIAEAVARLVDEGNTIPFIARYRKELTGSMDDQTLRELVDRLAYLRQLEKRRAEVRASIEEQGKLTEAVALALQNAQTLAEIEDVYRPYKPKRRTRAMIARERGLQPLAEILFAQDPRTESPEKIALPFVDAEKGVDTPEDALHGACDIIAEDISDDADLRGRLRALYTETGMLTSRAATEDDSVYRLYYDYTEPVSKTQSHRVLALNRGEREGFLKVTVDCQEDALLGCIWAHVLKNDFSITTRLVKEAAEDAWKRLMKPSLERELRSELTEAASESAVRMFSMNLGHVLMQPPVRGQVTLGLDPAYRTGCKLAVVDGTGKLLDTDVIYPTPPQNKVEEASARMKALIKRHGVQVIAIGNGTASRESELFVAGVIKELHGHVQYTIVNEAGASVYSASKLAAEEMPDKDVSLRSAASIARRLQDPLAELVKIDPKSIGVGQYQHDLPPARLSQSLDGTVESCVNAVGVDLNTASAALLSRVAGVGPSLARNIVAYREKQGRFRTRRELAKVPKLGPRAYEQCAGFLRIPDGEELMDRTGIHPESYDAAQKLFMLCGTDPAKPDSMRALPAAIRTLGEADVAHTIGVGVPTLRDMVAELLKPGRDPREALPPPRLRTDVMEMKDLTPGMTLTGTVRNVIDFGAFVDIGVHQDGLVHISELCDRYVKHPSEVVKAGDIVSVTVLSVDVPRKRIALTMKSAGPTAGVRFAGTGDAK